jgi:hypothetical protein
MSEPLILVLKDKPDKAVAYACPTCHCVIHAAQDDPDVDAAVRKHAAEHCVQVCSACGCVLIKKDGATKNYPGYGMRCIACEKKHDQERDQKCFDAAQHLTEEEWEKDACSGVVYLDGEDKYFPDGIDELREWWADFHYNKDKPDELPDFPEYVWVCEENIGVSLDAQQILESALEEHHEDAIDNVDVDGLQARLDEWCQAPENQVRSWEPNFKKLVLLDDEMNEKFLKRWCKESNDVGQATSPTAG